MGDRLIAQYMKRIIDEKNKEANMEYIAGYIIATIDQRPYHATNFSAANETTVIDIPYFTYWYMDTEDEEQDNRMLITDNVRKDAFEKFAAENKSAMDRIVEKHFKDTFKKDYKLIKTEFILDLVSPYHYIPTYRLTIEKGNIEA